ncbi:MAG: precorrin-6y C5,15-methyltransferase (decarboxylating) subunit CbiE [Chloroflexi bacterium]|nr:precorrin-6y C5,15-methyltransferase (decarboxylating) subunit CbiE [Chloroflexota bacterium]
MSGNKLYVIGVGPGGEEYITPVARRHIEQCDLLLGSPRLTRMFDKPSLELDLKEGAGAAIDFIKARKALLKVAVLVSGDPGLYSFLKVLSRHLPPEDYEVLPGISSMQLAFARLKDSWEDAHILSLHGREAEGLAEAVAQHPKVAIFTDSRWQPRAIARHLLEHGLQEREMVICEELSYPQERVVCMDVLGALEAPDVQGLALVIVRMKGV